MTEDNLGSDQSEQTGNRPAKVHEITRSHRHLWSRAQHGHRESSSHLAGIVFESSLIGRRENLFGLNRFKKNGLNRKSEHVEDSSYSSTA